jgi:hypothetical protein
MTKSRRGDCGSCHWFELVEGQQNGDRVGHCMVNPPVAMQGMQQNPLAPQQARMVLQGIRPPVAETDRCEKWRPCGVTPWTGMKALTSALDAVPHEEDADAAE